MAKAIKWKGSQANQFIEKLVKEWNGISDAGNVLYKESRARQNKLEKMLSE